MPGPGRSCFPFPPHHLAVSSCEGQSEAVFSSLCLLGTPAESAPQEGGLAWGLSGSWLDSGSVLSRGLVGPGSCLCPSRRHCKRPTKALGPGATQGPGETLPPPLVGWVDDGHAGASGALEQTVGASPPPLCWAFPAGPRSHRLQAWGSTSRHIQETPARRSQGRQVVGGRPSHQSSSGCRSLCLVGSEGRTCLGGWRTRGRPRCSHSPLGRGPRPPQHWHRRLRLRLWRPHPSSAAYAGLIPGRGTKIPRAAEQLRLCTMTEIPHFASETQRSHIKNQCPGCG